MGNIKTIIVWIKFLYDAWKVLQPLLAELMKLWNGRPDANEEAAKCAFEGVLGKFLCRVPKVETSPANGSSATVAGNSNVSPIKRKRPTIFGRRKRKK